MRTMFWVIFLMGTLLLPHTSSAVPSSHHHMNAKRLEIHGSWGVFKYELGERTVCFAAARPTKVAPRGIKRRHLRAYVATWHDVEGGAALRTNEVSFHVGGDLKGAKLTIDGKPFLLFGMGENAYVAERAKEQLLVTAMRAGKAMAISATLKDGTATRDIYSLSGITAAIKASQKHCSNAAK